MPAKLTIEQIQEFISEYDINSDCILLSAEYKNIYTPLKFYCNSCGDIFERDWNHLRQRKIFCCQRCAKKRSGQRKTIGIEGVKEYLQQNDINHDCTLLSDVYINQDTPLKFLCNKCGQIFERDWAHLKRGRFQCPKCGIHRGATHKIYTKEKVEEEIGKRGFKMIGEYTDARTPFEAICKRGHKVFLRYSYFLIGHSGCALCYGPDHRGENSSQWKGGSTEIRDFLRKSIKKWKRDVLIRDGFTCALSGIQNSQLVIHHLQSYNTLLNQASVNTGIPILSRFSDYENEEYYLLRDELVRLHKIENGITLTRPIHDLFHSLYGKGNNTKKQFDEFTQRYFAGEFKDQ